MVLLKHCAPRVSSRRPRSQRRLWNNRHCCEACHLVFGEYRNRAALAGDQIQDITYRSPSITRGRKMSAQWWMNNGLAIIGFFLTLVIALYQADISRWFDRYRQSRAKTSKQKHLARLKRQVAFLERLSDNASAAVAYFVKQIFFSMISLAGLAATITAGRMRPGTSEIITSTLTILACVYATNIILTGAYTLQIADRLLNQNSFFSRYRAAIARAEIDAEASH
jgi:hypothetical protein